MDNLVSFLQHRGERIMNQRMRGTRENVSSRSSSCLNLLKAHIEADSRDFFSDSRLPFCFWRLLLCKTVKCFLSSSQGGWKLVSGKNSHEGVNDKEEKELEKTQLPKKPNEKRPTLLIGRRSLEL